MKAPRKSPWADIRASVKLWRDSSLMWNAEAIKAHAELRTAHARIAELEADRARGLELVALLRLDLADAQAEGAGWRSIAKRRAPWGSDAPLH
jgi:hypothetical protein